VDARVFVFISPSSRRLPRASPRVSLSLSLVSLSRAFEPSDVSPVDSVGRRHTLARPSRALASEDADDERESGDGAARVRDVDVVRARRAREDDEIDGATLGTVSTRDGPGARLRR
tara:strand:+ start:876 stop:1223 length:348 start_codon:yes stop_codon:yes gene_type:complete